VGGNVHEWDWETGLEKPAFQVHHGRARVVLKLDETHVVTSGDDGWLTVRDTATGRVVETIRTGDRLLRLSFHEEKRWIAAASSDRSVNLFAVREHGLERVVALRGHWADVRDAVLSADGRHLASVGDDLSVRLWDVEQKRETHSVQVARQRGNCVAFGADARLVFAGDDRGAIHVCDAGSGRVLQVLRGHLGAVLRVAFVRQRGWLLSTGLDGTLRFWDVSGLDGVTPRTVGRSAHVRVLATVGDTVVSSGAGSTIRLWGNTNLRARGVAHGHVGHVTCLAPIDHVHFASGGTDRTIRIWDIRIGGSLSRLGNRPSPQLEARMQGANMEQEERAPGHRMALTALCALGSPALVSASKDGTLRLWNWLTGKELATRALDSGSVDCLLHHRQQECLLAGTSDGLLAVWDLRADTIQRHRGHEGELICLASVDATHAASAALDGTIRLWHLPSMESVTLSGPGGVVQDLDYGAGAGLLVGGSTEGELWIYSRQTGRGEILAAHDGAIRALRFVGKDRLVSCGEDGVIRLWDTERRTPLGAISLGVPVSALVVLPDERICVGTESGEMAIFRLESRRAARRLRAPAAVGE
jgi:WD40 repeat protein